VDRGLRVAALRAVSLAVFAIAAASTTTIPAAAAELKVNFAELAGLVRELTKDAKVHIHNVPASGLAVLTAPAQSYFEFVGHKVELTVPVQDGSAPLIGTYSYYVNDLNLKQLTVTGTGEAVRVAMAFEAPKYALVPSDDRLPSVRWERPMLTFDFVPVQVGNSVSLAAANIEVKGALKPECTTASILCNLIAINKARAEAKVIPTRVRDALKAEINGPAVRDNLAKTLAGYLTIGQVGQVKVKSVKATSGGVVVSFCLEGC
jgi:hypothetical protein